MFTEEDFKLQNIIKDELKFFLNSYYKEYNNIGYIIQFFMLKIAKLENEIIELKNENKHE